MAWSQSEMYDGMHETWEGVRSVPYILILKGRSSGAALSQASLSP